MAHMTAGDFYGTEQSHVMQSADSVNIVFTPADREKTFLTHSLYRYIFLLRVKKKFKDKLEEKNIIIVTAEKRHK